MVNMGTIGPDANAVTRMVAIVRATVERVGWLERRDTGRTRLVLVVVMFVCFIVVWGRMSPNPVGGPCWASWFVVRVSWNDGVTG